MVECGLLLNRVFEILKQTTILKDNGILSAARVFHEGYSKLKVLGIKMLVSV